MRVRLPAMAAGASWGCGRSGRGAGKREIAFIFIAVAGEIEYELEYALASNG